MKGPFESLPKKIVFVVFSAPRDYHGLSGIKDLTQDLADSHLHGLTPAIMFGVDRTKPEGLTYENVTVILGENGHITKGTNLLAWKQL